MKSGQAQRAHEGSPALQTGAITGRVRSFYGWWVGTLNHDKRADPIRNRAKVRSFVSRRLYRSLYAQNLRDYDADYFLQAQDWDRSWSSVRVDEARVQGLVARLRITLGYPHRDGLGPQPLRLKMVRESGAWKIDEVVSLRQ